MSATGKAANPSPTMQRHSVTSLVHHRQRRRPKCTHASQGIIIHKIIENNDSFVYLSPSYASAHRDIRTDVELYNLYRGLKQLHDFGKTSELSLRLPMGHDHMLTGIIDQVEWNPHSKTITVCDVKTFIPRTALKPPHKINSAYQRQVLFYCIMLYSMIKRPMETLLEIYVSLPQAYNAFLNQPLNEIVCHSIGIPAGLQREHLLLMIVNILQLFQRAEAHIIPMLCYINQIVFSACVAMGKTDIPVYLYQFSFNSAQVEDYLKTFLSQKKRTKIRRTTRCKSPPLTI